MLILRRLRFFAMFFSDFLNFEYKMTIPYSLISSVRDFNPQLLVVRASRTLVSEKYQTVGMDTGTFDGQIEIVVIVALVEDELLYVLRDSDPVFSGGRVVSASKEAAGTQQVVVRNVIQIAIVQYRLYAQSRWLSEDFLRGVVVADDEFGAVDDHPVVIGGEFVADIGQAYQSSDTAGGLKKQLPDIGGVSV